MQRKTYKLEFMLSLKEKNKERPLDMGLLDFPHKKGRKRKMKTGDLTEGDKFNNTVKELRILLNKLSNDNFDKVSR
jgi:hypothetical protein